jgi:hypothetical protein
MHRGIATARRHPAPAWNVSTNSNAHDYARLDSATSKGRNPIAAVAPASALTNIQFTRELAPRAASEEVTAKCLLAS